MTDEEKLAKMREQYHGKGPIKSGFTFLGGMEAEASVGFQIHDKDGNLIVDTTEENDNG